MECIHWIGGLFVYLLWMVFLFSSSVTAGRQHINGVQLYYERTGIGKHAVLLIPGALGKMHLQIYFNIFMQSFFI